MKPFISFLLGLVAATNLFAQPSITAFSPASGTIGSSVTITGKNFNNSIAQNIIFFGATRATVTAASTTSLTVTVPLGATYQYLSVTNLATGLTAYSLNHLMLLYRVILVLLVNWILNAANLPGQLAWVM